MADTEGIDILGMDLGKQSDPASIAIVTQTMRPHASRPKELEPVYFVRGLRRWPLGTDYAALADDVCKIVLMPPLNSPPFAFDCTGPGIPFGDILRRLEPACHLRPITITAGANVTETEFNAFNVAKRKLVGALVAVYASGRIKVRPDKDGSQEGKVLERQIQALTIQITKAGNETFEIPRDGSGHGDLAVACALAIWLGENTPLGWDGSLGSPQTVAEGRSILSTARDVFATDDLSAWRGERERQIRKDGRVDERDIPWENRSF